MVCQRDLFEHGRAPDLVLVLGCGFQSSPCLYSPSMRRYDRCILVYISRYKYYVHTSSCIMSEWMDIEDFCGYSSSSSGSLVIRDGRSCRGLSVTAGCLPCQVYCCNCHYRDSLGLTRGKALDIIHIQPRTGTRDTLLESKSRRSA